MGLFGKSTQKRQLEQQRAQLFDTAFSHREMRLGRSKSFDPVRRQWRRQRLVDGRWIDDGPLDPAEWRRRLQEWVNAAPYDPHFEADLAHAGALFHVDSRVRDALYVEACVRAWRHR